MADNTTRPNTTGGDVIRSEDETAQKTQVFRIGGGRQGDDADRRILPVQGASSALLEQIRDAKLSRNEMLYAMRRANERSAGAPPAPPTLAKISSPLDVVGSDVRAYFENDYYRSTGTWTQHPASNASTTNFTQATSTRRPGVTTSPSGATELVFDGAFGANPDLVSNTVIGGLPVTYTGYYCVACTFMCSAFNINLETNFILFSGGDNLGISTTGFLAAGGGGAVTNVAITTGVRYRLIIIAHASSVVMYLNGVAQTGTGTDATFGQTYRTGMELGGHNVGTVYGGNLGSLLFAQNDVGFSWSVADLDRALLAKC